MLKLVLLVLGVFALFVSVNSSQSYYVSSSSGSDSNNGAMSTPFKTISKCGAVMAFGDTCYIRAGTYRETVKPVNDNVTFTAYQGEAVTVSGADIIDSSSWSLYKGSIYKTTLKLTAYARNQTYCAANSLFVSGLMMPTARHPNIAPAQAVSLDMNPAYAYVDSASVASDLATITLSSSTLTSLPSTYNLAGATTTFTFGKMYFTVSCPVKSANGGSPSMVIDCKGRDGFATASFSADAKYGSNAPAQGNRWYMWGSLSLLDHAGEWYYDAATTTVYLWLPDSTDPRSNGKRIEVWKRYYTFDLSNRKGVVISNINTMAGTILTTKTQSLTLSNLTMAYLWHHMDLSGGGSDGNGALVITGNDFLIVNCSLGPSSSGLIQMTGSASRNVFTNNVIHHIAYEPYVSVLGMAAGGANYGMGANTNLLVQNTMLYSGDAMLRFKNGLNIKYNDMWQATVQRNDFGLIYAYKWDYQYGEVAYNFAHDTFGTKATQTKFAPGYGSLGSGGLYCDAGAHNLIFYRNVVWNCSSGGVLVTGMQPRATTGVTANLTFAYNTLYGNYKDVRAAVGEGAPLDGSFANIVLTNNNYQSTQIQSSVTGFKFSTTNVAGTSASTFVDVNNADFHQKAGAITIGKASNLGSKYGLPSTLAHPDASAYDVNLPDFLPGALLRYGDIQNLIFTCSTPNGGMVDCAISKMPYGRKISLQTVVKIGSGASSACVGTFDYTSVMGSGMCAGIDASKGGVLSIQIFHNGPWIATTVTITAATTTTTKAPTTTTTTTTTTKAPTTTKAAGTTTTRPATSANGTVVNAGSGGKLYDNNGDMWSIGVTNQTKVNGVIDATTGNVIQIVWCFNMVWQQNAKHKWWHKQSAMDTEWLPVGGTAAGPFSPKPNTGDATSSEDFSSMEWVPPSNNTSSEDSSSIDGGKITSSSDMPTNNNDTSDASSSTTATMDSSSTTGDSDPTTMPTNSPTTTGATSPTTSPTASPTAGPTSGSPNVAGSTTGSTNGDSSMSTTSQIDVHNLVNAADRQIILNFAVICSIFYLMI